MDGESEGLRRQVARLDLTIQAEMEKGKVLQVVLMCQPTDCLFCQLMNCWAIKTNVLPMPANTQLTQPDQNVPIIYCVIEVTLAG